MDTPDSGNDIENSSCIRKAWNASKNTWNSFLCFLVKLPIPSWRTLRGFGQSKALRTSYFWFVFVPIAAKILLQFEGPISVPLFGKVHAVNLDLPFSWYEFFFSAVAFSAANLVFSLRCPGIVKEYSTPYESYMAGNGFVFLSQELVSLPGYIFSEQIRSDLLYSLRSAQNASGFSDGSANLWLADHPSSETPSAFEVSDLILSDVCRIKRDEMGELFLLIYRCHSNSLPISRIFVTLCYFFGFTLIGLVLWDNIESVISTLH